MTIEKVTRGTPIKQRRKRVRAMEKAYRSGETLDQIAKQHGITRKGVWYLLDKYCGITGKDGGVVVRRQNLARSEPK